MILAWVFVPFYLRSGVYTMPEFLERRYGPACRWYLTTVSVIAYVVTKISVSLYAGALVLQAVLGWDFYTSATVMVVTTGVYTVFGGLAAVIYTELLQAVVLLLGAATLTIIGLEQVGGMAGLRAALPPDYFHMIKPSSDSGVPVDRHLLRRADPRRLVLVHRSDDRAARARRKERSARARRRALLRPLEDSAGVRPRAARAHRQGALSRHQRGRGVSDAGHPAAADRPRRLHGRGAHGGVDVVARGGVQLGVDARDLRHLQECSSRPPPKRSSWASAGS